MSSAELGSNSFENVLVPILWGTRGIFAGSSPGRLRVMNLAAIPTALEIEDNRPAEGVSFHPRLDGYGIKRQDEVEYVFDPRTLVLRDLAGEIDELEIAADFVRVGSHRVGACQLRNLEVGILVDSDGMGLGAQLPDTLSFAKL